MLGDLFSSIAQYYGYKTLGSLLGENFGLIVVLIAFAVVGFLFSRLLKKQFPTQGKEPGKFLLFKVMIFFFIGSFIFICAFTLFYEKKKLDKEKAEQSSVIPNGCEESPALTTRLDNSRGFLPLVEMTDIG